MHIGNTGRSRADRMHDAFLAIDPDVRFHAEVASRPEEFHPQPLSDPYVTLSRHTAPIIQPCSLSTSSDEITAVRHPSSCTTTALRRAFAPIGSCTCVWPIVRAHGRCAYKDRASLSDKTPRSSSTTRR